MSDEAQDGAPDEQSIIEAMGAAAAAGEADVLAGMLAAHPTLINRARGDGWTALHLASYYGHTEAVRALLAAGAHTDVLSENATSNMPLHAAIAGECRSEVISALLEAGADVNGVAGHGVTPLHLAGARGERVTADLLLSRGADPRARMDDGKMPFHYAEERGHVALAQRLEGLAAP